MKIAVYLLMCIFVSTIAFASIPDYSVTIDFETEVVMNSSTIGDVVLTKNSYISEEFSITSFNDIQSQFQNFDILQWNNNSFVEITSPNSNTRGLSFGEKYKFTESGQYTIKEVNGGQQKTFIVSLEDTLRIELDIETDLKIEYPETIIVNNQEVVEIELNVDASFEPKEYDVQIKTISDKNTTNNRKIELAKDYQFGIVENTLQNRDFQSDTNENWGIIKIRNDGNLDYNVNVDISGPGSQFISSNSQYMLFENNNVVISFIAQIPAKEPDGKFPLKITLSNEEVSKTFDYNISVRDLLQPEFVNVSFQSRQIYEDNRIEVYAKDNLGVEKVNMTYGDFSYEFEKDQQYFYADIVVNETGLQTFYVCIYDISNNSNCENVKFSFSKFSLVEQNNNIEILPIKTKQFYKVQIFNLTKDVGFPINITLENFYSNTRNISLNDGYIIRLFTDFDGVKQFASINDTLQLQGKGSVFLELRGDVESEIDFTLIFSEHEGINKINNIHFVAEFVDFEIPQSFVKEWYNDNAVCNVNIGDTYNDTYYRCLTYHPASLTSKELLLPVSIKEKELLDEKIEEYESEKIKAAFLTVFISTCLIIIIVFLSFYTLYKIKVEPFYVTFNSKRKKDSIYGVKNE